MGEVCLGVVRADGNGPCSKVVQTVLHSEGHMNA